MFTHESRENYLEQIYILGLRQSRVRSIDLASEMNFSKPSVSRAVKQLKELGFIHIEHNGNIHLTDDGLLYARKIYDRHQFFSDFLLFLGVDERTAQFDACRMEHAISQESYQAIKKYIEYIRSNCTKPEE